MIMPPIEADFLLELAGIQAEFIGWMSLEDGVYLHVADEEATEILVVGLVHADMQASIVLWVY